MFGDVFGNRLDPEVTGRDPRRGETSAEQTPTHTTTPTWDLQPANAQWRTAARYGVTLRSPPHEQLRLCPTASVLSDLSLFRPLVPLQHGANAHGRIHVDKTRQSYTPGSCRLSACAGRLWTVRGSIIRETSLATVHREHAP
jgi:hypothetical protein